MTRQKMGMAYEAKMQRTLVPRMALMAVDDPISIRPMSSVATKLKRIALTGSFHLVSVWLSHMEKGTPPFSCE